MSGWTDDPELVTIFRAEVDERLASLRDGLLPLEEHPAPQAADRLAVPRRPHGQGLGARARASRRSSSLAHRSEDLLGALRDGRFAVRRDLVDLLLVAAEGIGRAMPGTDRARPAPTTWRRSSPPWTARWTGRTRSRCPRLAGPVAEADADDAADVAETYGRRGDTVRVPTRRVHDLLDVVGEAELEVRRIERTVGRSTPSPGEQARVGPRAAPAGAARRGGSRRASRLRARAGGALADRLQAATRDLRGRLEDAQAKLGPVRDGAMGLAMVPVRRVVASFPQLVREVGDGDRQGRPAGPRGRGRRARHPRAGRCRRRAAAPRHQRRRPRLRDRRPSGPAAGQAGPADRTRVRPRRRLGRRHRGRRRRRRHRRGRAARRRRAPRPAPRGQHR